MRERDVLKAAARVIGFLLVAIPYFAVLYVAAHFIGKWW
jgi:hypothetical protein